MDIIDYKPPRTVDQFICHYKYAELFYSFIVGPVGCLPADSEFLTPTGWKRMDAHAPGDLVGVYDRDTRAVSYEPAAYVRLPSSAPFWRFDSGSLEMELSPEHTILYDDYRGGRKTCTAQEAVHAPSRRTIPTTWRADAPDLSVSDDMIRFRVMFSADGHIPDKGGRVTVTLRKERKKARLRELAAACGIEMRERTYDARPTETIFSFAPPDDLAKDLSWVWSLSARQLEVVLDECTHWDGLADHDERRYYTTVPGNADAIQYAAHATGLRASLHWAEDARNPDWKPVCTVAIRAGDHARNRAMVRAETRITRRVSPDGFKYCFTTSTGFFIARCNGTVFITGNSGKTTGLFMKLVYMAQLQNPGPDGIRRTRAVIVRNTAPQLRDTTLVSWGYWFRDGVAGKWLATDKNFILRFGDVECVVMFRPLDTPDDISRVLSLEINFAILDEFVEIPRAIVEALSGRLGRFKLPDGTKPNIWGMWGSSNTSTEDNWWHDFLLRQSPDPEQNMPASGQYFLQPGGLHPNAENLENLPGGRDYYVNLKKGKSEVWINQFIHAQWGFSITGKPWCLPSKRLFMFPDHASSSIRIVV